MTEGGGEGGSERKGELGGTERERGSERRGVYGGREVERQIRRME